MAVTWIGGFEMGTDATYEMPLVLNPASNSRWTVTGTGLTVDSTIFRTGAASLKVDASSGAATYLLSDNDVTLQDASLRFYFRITTLPSVTRQIIGPSGVNANVRVTSTGAIEFRNATTVVGTSTLLCNDTTRWYGVEFVSVFVSGSNYSITCYLEGVSLGSSTFTSPVCPNRFGVTDTGASAMTIYYDDCARYNDTAGPHPGRSVLLVPTSVNAAGGWVEGDGAGTANMAAAVATKPPPGVASASETNATNIESPTNSATDNCDMNMTTYPNAGLRPSDTVRGMIAFVRHGEDIATATKGGALAIVSNPTQAGEDTFNFGEDDGAHGAEVNLWRWQTGTTQTAAPDLTSNAVMRVGKRTATTRVVCVDFMGIYVDYEEHRAPPFKPRYRMTRAVR